MKYDYEKITNDLKKAKELALAAAETVPDEGSINSDGLFLSLPRSSEEKMIKIIHASALSGFKITGHKFFGTGYLISPPAVGRAYKNTKAAEAMQKHLHEQGYDVLQWYQAD